MRHSVVNYLSCQLFLEHSSTTTSFGKVGRQIGDPASGLEQDLGYGAELSTKQLAMVVCVTRSVLQQDGAIFSLILKGNQCSNF